jgi:hypothetical protein
MPTEAIEVGKIEAVKGIIRIYQDGTNVSAIILPV